ncbi:sheath polysaccharide-degrading enzyme [Streptomyces sp. NRRL F-5755]|uniref:right-handed parallel beta-helix repeat-containing protein n=1 Tax=Streptomyces sp. NRRL F-5755 TaxID=1519475 RepID=UPI0006AE1914|nr:right-handed parallel beta-helix repeat-containing protein [Streptomyces sp. NRRL F-5755]KOU08918.1 sheath polysaccharide-degrading enzyme [Streptomyces sp. NRRL F-5755]
MRKRSPGPLTTAALLAIGALLATSTTAHGNAPATAAAPTTARTIDVSTPAQLKSALSEARPGDTIRLADGTYKGNFRATTAAGASSRITLTGSAKAVLSAGGGYGLHLDGASYWTVRGITVTGGQKGIVADAARGVVLDSVTVHGLDMEGVHFRKSSRDGVLKNSKIYETGRDGRGMGEGVYVGSAGGTGDRSDNVQILHNTIGPGVGGENIDIKEGTTGAKIIGNTFDGSGLTGAHYDDSWADIKGNQVLVEDNTGRHTRNNGYETHSQQPGWGCGTVFRNNRSDLSGATGPDRYGFHITNYQAAGCPVTITADNKVTGGRGIATPGVPVG